MLARRPPQRTDAEKAADDPRRFAMLVSDYLTDVDAELSPTPLGRGDSAVFADMIAVPSRPDWRQGMLVTVRDGAATLADRTRGRGATHVIVEVQGRRAVLASSAALAPVLVDEQPPAVEGGRVLYLGLGGRASLLAPAAASGDVEQVVGVVLGSRLTGLVQAAVGMEHRVTIA